MNILSTFGGIECGKVALDRVGVKYKRYYSSEIDKYATQITRKNHPDVIQLGDVQFITGQQFDAVGGIDLLIGGSPCQGFSFAGKQLNFDDPRSALFFEFVRLKKELRPKYFLLENVKMKKDFQNIITEYLGVEPIEINSALVSAQNRRRLYWTNIPNIEQPKDKGILLKDILEQEVDSKYITNMNFEKRFDYTIHDKENPKNKAQYLRATDYKGTHNVIKISKQGKIKQNQDKASTLTAGAHSGGNHSDMDLLCVASRGRYNKDGSTSQKIEPRKDNKTNSLTTVQKDNMLLNDYFIRRLTPTECERLQTLPDNYTEGVSNTQRYKMLGNGWTVDVIAHIFNNLPK